MIFALLIHFLICLALLILERGSWACAFEDYVDSRGQQFSWSRFTTVFAEIHTKVIQCFTFIQINRNTTKWQITSSSKTGVRHVVMQSRRFRCYGLESMPQDIYSPYWSSGQIRVSGHGINIFINNLSLLSFGGNEHKFLQQFVTDCINNERAQFIPIPCKWLKMFDWCCCSLQKHTRRV